MQPSRILATSPPTITNVRLILDLSTSPLVYELRVKTSTTKSQCVLDDTAEWGDRVSICSLVFYRSIDMTVIVTA